MAHRDDTSISVEDKKEIYRAFIEWMKNGWYGVPESDEVEPLMMARYSPEEATLLTGFPFAPMSLDELSQLKKIPALELEHKLVELARKGIVYRYVNKNTVFYSLHDTFSMLRTLGWQGKTDDYTRTVSPILNRYCATGFLSPWKLTTHQALRVLPIESTIKDGRQVIPYEEVTKILDNVTYFTVSPCPCAHRNNLDSERHDCTYPIERCLHFGRLGHYIVEQGMGREITRQETEELLRKCEELGLVHAISNQQENPDTLCNCCPCCCMWFEAYHKLDHPMSMSPSHYRAHTGDTTCTGCGLCVKRCPMKAIQLKEMPEAKGRKTVVTEEKKGTRTLTNKLGKVAEVTTERCIGCGVCVHKCPSGSLSLTQSESVQDPPKTIRDWAIQFMTDCRNS
ncbi:MAG: 4Fe-4S dicluster domain-containing protein [Deltaproteobacteria bacterium]|nr:4Fe-4S dicluster domain-containing protein [Deltaproteobacteria bacterium]